METKRAGAKEMAEVRLPPGSRAQRWEVAWLQVITTASTTTCKFEFTTQAAEISYPSNRTYMCVSAYST